MYACLNTCIMNNYIGTSRYTVSIDSVICNCDETLSLCALT